MIGQINPPQTQNTNPYFFKDLEELSFTQTTLFLLNYSGILHNFNLSSLSLTTHLIVNENFVNAYLENADIKYRYNTPVLYLVFNKEAKYLNNIKQNNKNLTILEYLEESKETIDFYEDNYNYIFTYKPNNLEFFDMVKYVKSGYYLMLKPLAKSDIICNFVNNLLKQKGLYEIMQMYYDLDHIPKPFVKIDKLTETYSESTFTSAKHKDFITLKKYT
jgi:hypothetical protein